MRIAYVVAAFAFPRLSTFVVNEMLEVRRLGHEVFVAPLYSAAPASVRHGTFEELRPSKVLPSQLFGVKVACLAVWMLVTRPRNVFGVLLGLHFAAGLNPYAHAAIVAIAPKALATAWRLRRLKVDHIHAHFATHTATCAATT
jgi:colanic acid/amylovoran biosynthesis glycosyltransferase